MERRTFSRVENNHVDRIFSSLSSSPTLEGGSFSAGLASARTGRYFSSPNGTEQRSASISGTAVYAGDCTGVIEETRQDKSS